MGIRSTVVSMKVAPHTVFTWYIGFDLLEVLMAFRARQGRARHAALVGAVVAAMTLAIGVVPRSAAAQYAYPGPAYSYPPQSYPVYPSYPPYGQKYNGAVGFRPRRVGLIGDVNPVTFAGVVQNSPS
jgi:hypothetical protein